MEKLVADQHNQGKETQLEVAGGAERSSVTCEISPFTYCSYSVFVGHSLQLCWRLCLISTDDEQREKDGKQATAAKKTKAKLNTV